MYWYRFYHLHRYVIVEVFFVHLIPTNGNWSCLVTYERLRIFINMDLHWRASHTWEWLVWTNIKRGRAKFLHTPLFHFFVVFRGAIKRKL